VQRLIQTTMTLFLFAGLTSAYANEVIEAAAGKAIEAGFTELERQLIKKYLGGDTEKPATRGVVYNNATLKKKQEQSLPPGLAQKKELPPGLAAQLKRNGTLPPGLAKRSLPDDLVKQLPPAPEGYERSILDDLTVVLVETATNRIVDIIFDAVTDDGASSPQKKQ